MMPDVIGDNSQIHFYTQDDKGVVLYANKVTMDFFCAKDENDFIGISLINWDSQKGHVEHWIDHSRAVIQDKTPRMFIDSAIKHTGETQWFRTYRTPLYGHRGSVLGIHGVSVPISKQSLIPLTPQQTACLKQLALGNTHKQIAHALGLSTKTVEHYLEAIKMKLNCHSRSELILQAIERGLVGVF